MSFGLRKMTFCKFPIEFIISIDTVFVLKNRRVYYIPLFLSSLVHFKATR